MRIQNSLQIGAGNTFRQVLHRMAGIVDLIDGHGGNVPLKSNQIRDTISYRHILFPRFCEFLKQIRLHARRMQRVQFGRTKRQRIRGDPVLEPLAGVIHQTHHIHNLFDFQQTIGFRLGLNLQNSVTLRKVPTRCR
jgi:hypothetical protein